MTDKKEIEKEQVKEPKSRKRKQEVETSPATEVIQEEETKVVEEKVDEPVLEIKVIEEKVDEPVLEIKAVEEKVDEPVLETKIEEEKVTEKEESEAQLSSLDILWHNAFNELDEWAKRGDFRDEVFLKEAKFFADNIQRNQGNIKAISEKFNKEFAEWERTAREEFLMSTTSLQHFFPLRSYEEINAQIDQIQKRTMSILHKPFQAITNNQAMDKYLEIINQYIAIRKKSRMQYIKTVKQAGNLIYENQKGFVNLFARQIKTLMFPLNKYMEKAEELTKS